MKMKITNILFLFLFLFLSIRISAQTSNIEWITAKEIIRYDTIPKVLLVTKLDSIWISNEQVFVMDKPMSYVTTVERGFIVIGHTYTCNLLISYLDKDKKEYSTELIISEMK